MVKILPFNSLNSIIILILQIKKLRASSTLLKVTKKASGKTETQVPERTKTSPPSCASLHYGLTAQIHTVDSGKLPAAGHKKRHIEL